jgi:Family of unknown function (DUF5947)
MEDPNLPGPTNVGEQGDRPGQAFIRTLRSFREQRSYQEKCEFCGTDLEPSHRHLLEISKNRIVCTCSPCALRFQDVVGGRFRLIPREVRYLPELNLSDAEWESLALPINLAFFFYSTPQQKMTAMYPSPAGATESLLPLPAWDALIAQNSALTMQPDVEALLVNRVGSKRDYYVVPIDVCFELIGIIRVHWRGLSGGEVVWEKVDSFFSNLKVRSCS